MTPSDYDEIREPTVDHPLTLIVRPVGDNREENWEELPGSTMRLPDTSRFGFEVKVHERVLGAEKIVSQTIYIPAPLPDDAPENHAPGKVLERHRWTLAGDYEVRCAPGVTREKVDWLKPISAQQAAWIRLQKKIKDFADQHPLVELAARNAAPGLVGRLHDYMESRYGLKQCGQCLHWDGKEGKKEYQKVTHTFDGGEVGRMNVDIAAICASERSIRNLVEEKVGLCTIRRMLIECDFQACSEFEEVP